MTPQVTALGIRDGDPDVLQALVDRRGFAVLAFCERACPPGTGVEAAADAFARFRAMVQITDRPGELDPEAALLSATRHAAAMRVPKPSAAGPSGFGRLLGGRGQPEPIADVPQLLAKRADGLLDQAGEERLTRLLEASPEARAVEQRFRAAEHAYLTARPRQVASGVLEHIVETMAGTPRFAAAPPANGEVHREPEPADAVASASGPVEGDEPDDAVASASGPLGTDEAAATNGSPPEPPRRSGFFAGVFAATSPPPEQAPASDGAVSAQSTGFFAAPAPDEATVMTDAGPVDEPDPSGDAALITDAGPLGADLPEQDAAQADAPPTFAAETPTAPQTTEDAYAAAEAGSACEAGASPEDLRPDVPEADALAEDVELAAQGDAPQGDAEVAAEADAPAEVDGFAADEGADEDDADLDAGSAIPAAEDAAVAAEGDGAGAVAADFEPDGPDDGGLDEDAPVDAAGVAAEADVLDAASEEELVFEGPDEEVAFGSEAGDAGAVANEDDVVPEPQLTEEWEMPADELAGEDALDTEIAAARLAHADDLEEDAAHLQSASGAVDEPLLDPHPADDPVAEATVALDPEPVPVPESAPEQLTPSRGVPRIPAERTPIPGKSALVPAGAVVTIAAIGALAASGVFGGSDPAPPLDTGIVPPRALQAVPEGEAAEVVDDLRSGAGDARRRRLADRRQALASEQLRSERQTDEETDTEDEEPAADDDATSPSAGGAADEDTGDAAPDEDATEETPAPETDTPDAGGAEDEPTITGEVGGDDAP